MYVRSISISILIMLWLVIFVALQPLEIRAQAGGGTTGSIFGKVKDEQGAVIAGASVTVRDLETNQQYLCATKEEGIYQLFRLRPGRYQIKAEAEGFITQTLNIRLLLGVIATNEIVLPLAETKAVIEVTNNATIDNPDETEGSTNITTEKIETLPINTRNFLDFSLTAARVTPDRLPPQGVISTSGLSFNGQSSRENIINVDGLDNNDFTSGAVRATFSQEAVQEYQIISDGYSAEFGRALGGIVNIITKSGSNQFHGSTFFFTRNEQTSAREAFLSIKPPFEQYQFGATLSGPIKENRAFFFTAFERLSVKQNNVVTISDNIITSIRKVGFAINNGAIPVAVSTLSGLMKIDLLLSPSNRLNIRFNKSGRYNGAAESFGGIVADSATGVLQLRENSLALSNTYTSPNTALINETRFLYNQRRFDIDSPDPGPQAQIVTNEGLVTFGRSIFVPKFLRSNLFQFSNVTSLIKGRQEIKFGGDLIYLRDRSRLSVSSAGIAIFAPIDFTNLGPFTGAVFSGLEAFDPSIRTGQQRAFLTFFSAVLSQVITGFPSGLDLANLPIPVFYQQGFPPNNLLPTRPRSFALFLQDNIKVNSQLLVKAGLRYDISRSSFVPNNNGNFAPRLALSYNPGFLPKARLSASYGLFFTAARFGSSEVLVEPNSPRNFFMPFPFSVIAFMQPGRKFSSQAAVPPSIPLIPQLTVGPRYQPDIRISYSQQINLGIDYQLKNRIKLELDYSFVRGIKINRLRDINPITRPVPSNPLESFLTGRLDPNNGAILYFESAADSYYHAFTASLGGQIFNGFDLLVHYTFAKSIDNFLDVSPAIPGSNPIDPLNPGRERALSIQDLRNRFVFSGIYQTGSNRTRLLKDLTFSTIVTLESGRPYNLIVGADLDMNGDFPPSDRPLGIGRNTGITPGFADVSMRLSRVIKFNEKIELQALVEAFNLFNRVNISQIDGTFPPDQQGRFNLPRQENGRFIAPPERYRNAFPPRQFQFGIKLIW